MLLLKLTYSYLIYMTPNIYITIVNLSKLGHDLLLIIKFVDAINSLSIFYVQSTVLSMEIQK